MTVADVVSGALFAQTGKTVALSVDQLTACTNGCMGSTAQKTVGWFVENRAGAIATAESYKNDENYKQCLSIQKTTTAAIVSGVTAIKAKDEQALMEAIVKSGPIGVDIDAAPFRGYRGGLLKCTVNDTQVDDAMTVVGYNTDDKDKPYWIVKNSWGTDWGEQGYLMLAMGKQDCGASLAPWTVTVMRC